MTDLLEEFVFEDFPLVIGRGLEADITLEDRWVSRFHCEIRVVEGGLVVRDLASKHGTLLNDAPITEGVLKPSDILSVGLSTIVASYEVEGVDQGHVETTASS
jgi:pSer/pThr/pTyr-binding forkhead associated (FHA) protein